MGRSCKEIKKRILKDYPDVKVEQTADKRSCAEGDTIYLSKEDYEPKKMVDLFNILHEIGHVYTSEKWMPRAEREWRATTWAIFHMKKYGIRIPEWRKKNFQEDIYFWYELEKAFFNRDMRMKKQNLKLFWNEQESA